MMSENKNNLPAHESLNFEIPPGQRACFYEDMSPGSPSQVRAFVLAKGDMQIALNIYGPLENGDILQESFEEPLRSEMITASKEKESESQVVISFFDPPEQGSFAFCLDNRNAHVFSKLVQLEIIPADADFLATESQVDFDVLKDNKNAENYPELESTLALLQRIHKGIQNIRHQQQRDRFRLSLHSSMNEQNYNHVFYGSVIETLIFILVALFQVYFVRRWFAAKSAKKPKSWM